MMYRVRYTHVGTAGDEVTRAPAIVWSLGRFEDGREVDGLTQPMDLGPTILEIAGVGASEAVEARSLLPALQGEEWEGRRYVFAEHARDLILKETESMTMVRDREWKLVHFVDGPYGQLFDLRNDPGESRNLWDDPSYEEKKRELLDAILRWRIESDLQTRGWTTQWR